jgi:hypothetical protein
MAFLAHITVDLAALLAEYPCFNHRTAGLVFLGCIAQEIGADRPQAVNWHWADG